MANATSGRLFGCAAGVGDLSTVNPLRFNGAAISGVGTNRCFDTSDFPEVVNGDWQRYNGGAFSGAMGAVYRNSVALQYTPSGFDADCTGLYKLVGQVLDSTGAGYQAFVVVYPNAGPASPLRSSVTDDTGHFLFDWLAYRTYYVVAVDLQDVYNEVAASYVVSVPR